MKPFLPHKETYFVVYDNWTSQYLGNKTYNKTYRDVLWPHEPEQAKKFDKKSEATKAIKRLNKEFVEHGTPVSEIDFRVCKVQVEYVRTVTVLYKKK